MTIIELNEMIDMLSNFFHNTSHRMLMIGGIVGSHPLSHVLDVVTEQLNFDNVLILDGCADFAYIPKKFIGNYLPYQYMFADMYVPNVSQPVPFGVSLWKQSIPTVRTINQQKMNQYEVVIVNNAHLIEMDYLRMIIEASKWKCVLIGDPYDIGGEDFMHAPCIVDCLEKQSPIVGMARKLWDIPTKAIDKHVPGNVMSGKVTRKGIGKSDGRMYICNNLDILEYAHAQQMKQDFRKGQKFFVTDERIHHVVDEDKEQTHVINKNCMLVMHRANSLSPIPQQFRLYHSKKIIRLEIEYDTVQHLHNELDYHIRVKPGNVLTSKDARYHRYIETVLVCSGEELPKRYLYSAMKNSVNLAICTVKGSG